jgi:sigma-54 dependent transcriptional regulator, acetoin dehydrogenase operon transcriptional activator AcoR
MEDIMNTQVESYQKKMKQAWKNFLSEGGSTDDVRPEVLSAWKRCRDLGTDPYRVVAEKLTNHEEIKRRLEKNEKLLAVSKPAIKYLYNFIAGSDLFVSVSDKDGYLLLVYADKETVQPKGGILYTNWNEKSMGNNPIGTAIAENRSLMVHGYEHYCMFPHYYTGAGSPIHDPAGNIIGAISMTGITKVPQQHTLGMMVMTAYGIERELKILDTLNSIDTAYNHRNTIIDSISEGLLVIDNDNRITFANQVVKKILSIENYSIIGGTIFSFFNDPLVKDIIHKRTSLTDYVTEISINNNRTPCTVTYRPIKSKHSNDGVIVVNELSRVKKLAKRITAIGSTVTFNEIIGENKRFMELIDTAKTLALTDSNVLLLGESGTGKDVFAQAIHNYSKLKNGPFIAINCGAIPKDLIYSELFGYVEGAFTGASKGGSIGKFELANGGTIFLDEIGELPLDLQASLLRVIENRVITPVGGGAPIPINVRIIAATNKHLPTEIKLNKFRQDLYYRLNILSMTLIPLRERKDDINPLIMFFLNQLNLKYEKLINNIPSETWDILIDYDWPGNVRELKNTLERCVALSKDSTISPELLPDDIINKKVIHEVKNHEIKPSLKGNNEAVLLKAMLEKSKWNITAVANELGVSRATIYRKVQKYGLD